MSLLSCFTVTSKEFLGGLRREDQTPLQKRKAVRKDENTQGVKSKHFLLGHDKTECILSASWPLFFQRNVQTDSYCTYNCLIENCVCASCEDGEHSCWSDFQTAISKMGKVVKLRRRTRVEDEESVSRRGREPGRKRLFSLIH